MAPKLNHYLHLHFIVFIWGFTAILGKLITLDALPLVWYRMVIAAALVLGFVLIKGNGFKVSPNIFYQLLLGGAALALHWVLFFLAIKVSNVSVALATMSTGALFTALIEPLWYQRKFIWYELFLGVIVVFGLFLIFKGESTYGYGMLVAMGSALMGVVFTLVNGKLVATEKASRIAFYELSIGMVLLTVFLGVQGGLNASFTDLSANDLVLIFILASVCTAYAFIGGIKVMEHVSPYTVILTVNLEPVYGILLAYFIFGEDERMYPMFYVGAVLIIGTVIANGVLKNKARLKKARAI